MTVRVALVTKGHPFDADAFFAVFDAMSDVAVSDVSVSDVAVSDGRGVPVAIEWTHVEHPEALALVEPDRAAEFDVFVMYDMPGITFTRGDPPAEFPDPPVGYVDAFEALLAAGKGMVFLHHAIAGWPAWERYAHIVGGRFHYQPASLDGIDYPDSGYRHDVTHTVEVLDAAHPICAGLESSFEITDEVYLFPVLDNDNDNAIHPLMASTYDFVDSNFYSADRAIRGTRNDRSGWAHPRGSNLVAWTKRVGASPIAYIQFGDGPLTYADPNYRRIVANAIAWAASG